MIAFLSTLPKVTLTVSQTDDQQISLVAISGSKPPLSLTFRPEQAENAEQELINWIGCGVPATTNQEQPKTTEQSIVSNF